MMAIDLVVRCPPMRYKLKCCAVLKPLCFASRRACKCEKATARSPQIRKQRVFADAVAEELIHVLL